MRRAAGKGVLANMAISIAVFAIGLVAVDAAVGRGLFGIPPLKPGNTVDVAELARRAAAARGDPFDARSIVEVIRGE